MAAQVRFAHHKSIRNPRKLDRNRNETYSRKLDRNRSETYSAYLFSELVNDDQRHTPEKLGINNPVLFQAMRRTRSESSTLARISIIPVTFLLEASDILCVVGSMRFLSEHVTKCSLL